MRRDRRNEEYIAESYMCDMAGELTIFANKPACFEVQQSFESLATDLPVLEDVSILITDKSPNCQGTAIRRCEITLIPSEEIGSREATYHNNYLLTESGQGVFRVDFFITRDEAASAYTIIHEALKRKNFRDREFQVLSHLHVKLLD